MMRLCIKYYGCHGMKQFIRGKPVRFGYKVWALNCSSGFCVDFQVYQGKSQDDIEAYEKVFGKCTAPLLKFMDNFGNNLKPLPFLFYFDNLFTSTSLLLELNRRNYGGTGTLRENKVTKVMKELLPRKKPFDKKERGAAESIVDKENNIAVTIWKDNKPVIIASNCHAAKPYGQCERYSRLEHARVKVQIPKPVKLYNGSMGGTDRMDQNVSTYRINVRGKKWYYPIFSWTIDVAVQNAWLIHRKSGGIMSLLQFRRTITVGYLTKFGQKPKAAGRPSTQENSIGSVVRFDQTGHFVGQNVKKMRCRGLNCTSIIRTVCKRCNVALCIPCFEGYHKK